MANIQTAGSWTKGQRPGYAQNVSIGALNSEQLVQLQSMLKNLGYYTGNVGDPPGLALAGAVSNFQVSGGYGAPSGTFTTEMWYGLNYANGAVTGGAPLDVGIWNTLAGARQMGVGTVLDPNTLGGPAPAGAIGVATPAAPNPIVAENQKPGYTGPGAQFPVPAAPTGGPNTTPFSPAPIYGSSVTPGTGINPPTPTPQAGTGGPVDFTNAYALIDSFLKTYDLGPGSEFDLSAWARQALTSPDFNEVVFQAQLEQTDAYRTRFGATNDARRAKGLPMMTPKEMLDYEQYSMGVLRAAGLPSSFYDNWRDYSELIGQGVSPAELQERVEVAQTYVYKLPPEVRQQFADWFGPGDIGSITAYVLDEEKALPMIQRQLTMAEIAGAGGRLGFGVDQGTAGTLADLGIDYQQAQQGFQRLDQIRPAFTESVGEATDLTAEGAGIGATFGTDAGAAGQIEKRITARQKNLQGGGGAERGQRGVTGLGQAV